MAINFKNNKRKLIIPLMNLLYWLESLIKPFEILKINKSVKNYLRFHIIIIYNQR
jgi:hypothetical protein